MKKLFKMDIGYLDEYGDPDVGPVEFYRAESAQDLFPIVDKMCRKEEEGFIVKEAFFGPWKRNNRGAWFRERGIEFSPHRFLIWEQKFEEMDEYPGVEIASCVT